MQGKEGLEDEGEGECSWVVEFFLTWLGSGVDGGGELNWRQFETRIVESVAGGKTKV